MRYLTYCRFVPADALWNLAMAINVYLTLFKKYNAQQLKALEYVFSEFIFPLWDQVLSLETCLGSVYSVDMFQGSIFPV